MSTGGGQGSGPGDPRGRPSNRWVRYSQGAAIVFEFTGTVLAGVVVGYFLDRYLDTAPSLLIIMTLLSVIGGFWRLVQIVRRLERQEIERR